MERNPGLALNMKQDRTGNGERLQQEGWGLDPGKDFRSEWQRRLGLPFFPEVPQQDGCGLRGSQPRSAEQELMEKLTQNAALHTAVVQQRGPWPLSHRPAQGLRKHVLPDVFSSHTQRLAQPSEKEVGGRGAQGTRTAPQIPGKSPTCG